MYPIIVSPSAGGKRESFSLGLTFIANYMKLASTVKRKKRNKVTYFKESKNPNKNIYFVFSLDRTGQFYAISYAS